MNQSVKIVIIVCFVSIFALNQPGSSSNWGTISGKVTDTNGYAIPDVNITLSGTPKGAASNDNGVYQIDQVAPGHYELRFAHIAYRTLTKSNILVKPGQLTQVDVTLIETALRVQEIVVTPGNFLVSQGQTARRQVIEKEKITSVPATLDDIYRVLQIMPGVGFSDDYSAHFHVRGGKQSENLILMDGMEIFDPYHLKHIGGAVGVMNMDLINDVAIMTGGFPARYGDKLSSVVAIENRVGQSQKLAGKIGAGGTGINLVLEGPVPAGSWLVSYRKSFLKEAAEILNPTDYTFSPSYYDAQGKLHFTVGPGNQIIANFLYSNDDTYLEKWHSDSDLFSNYGNGYYGVVWKSIIKPHILSELIISRGENFWDNHIGKEKQEKLNLAENVANWNLNIQPQRHHDIEVGVTYKYIKYDYSLKAERLSQDQQNLDELVESYYGDDTINSTTYKMAAYLQNKFRIITPLVANIGIRYDYFDYNTDRQWSPRVGLAYTIGKNTILRTAWGHFYQTPVYTELTKEKGAERNPTAEKAIHRVLGLEQYLGNNFSIRIEAYEKTLNRMIGYYFEGYQPPAPPIIQYGNPYNGFSKGVELFLNGKVLSRLSLWLTYAYSRTRIEASFVNWDKKSIERKTVPRFTDQPHNLSLFLIYQLGKTWELNLKWRYLSGSPYTPYYPAWDYQDNPFWKYGEYYSARYPAYHRMDVRIGKEFKFSGLNISAFLEIKNVYNQKNVLLYNYDIKNGRHLCKAYYTLPVLPTLEFTINF